MLAVVRSKGKDSSSGARHRLTKMQHTKFGELPNAAVGAMNAA
jgi:hypothetical protein